MSTQKALEVIFEGISFNLEEKLNLFLDYQEKKLVTINELYDEYNLDSNDSNIVHALNLNNHFRRNIIYKLKQKFTRQSIDEQINNHFLKIINSVPDYIVDAQTYSKEKIPESLKKISQKSMNQLNKFFNHYEKNPKEFRTKKDILLDNINENIIDPVLKTVYLMSTGEEVELIPIDPVSRNPEGYQTVKKLFLDTIMIEYFDLKNNSLSLKD